MSIEKTQSAPLSLVSAGVDYITATVPRTSKHERFHELGRALVEKQAQIGHEVRTWRASSYHGQQTDGVVRGLRHDTHIIRLSSEMAHEHWFEVYELANNITRLDCEITFQLKHRRVSFFREMEARAIAAKAGRGRKRTVELRANNIKGDALYIGSRQSEVYGRCYDKGMESKTQDAGWLVRQELEYKGDRAGLIAARLALSPSVEVECKRLVSSYMRSVEIETVRCKMPAEMSARGKSVSKLPKLGWLRGNVRPTVERLIAAGRLNDVLDALGLSAHVVSVADCAQRLTRKDDDSDAD